MTAHTYRGFHLLCCGRFEELKITVEKSTQLDPISSESFRNRGWYHYYGRQYDQAIDVLKAALALDPSFREVQCMLGYAYLRHSCLDDAFTQFLALPEGPYGATKWGALGETYATSGDTAAARNALNKLDALAETGYVSPVNRVAVHAGLHEWDRVFEGLEQAYADHSPRLSVLKVDPRFDEVRSDARFVNLLERMKLA